MEFVPLVSGSKGNCCLIKHKDTELVIDYGTTRRYLKSCFEQTSYDPMQSSTPLITYTHSDHIARMRLSDLISTYAAQGVITSHLYAIRPYDYFKLQDFRITVLPMSHDYESTVGYTVKTEDEKMVYVTDTGYIRDEVKEYIRNADCYVFESNYDIQMLMWTTGLVYLRQRIIGDCRHLCDENCSNILCDVVGDHTKEIVFAYISQEGNTRDMTLTTLKEALKQKRKDREDLRLYPADQFSICIGGKSS